MIESFLGGEDNALGRFTRDLTHEARVGKLEPVRSRDEEIARVVDILLRHGKNNPALVGPAGVGKTAIVEGLAQRVAAGGVPLALRDVRVLALDHVSLLAGTTYRGQYEERIRILVAETTAAPDVVLFVDELHNLIGQGTAVGAAMDAANMLKPALVRGDFRVIGATTDEEYARWVLGDPALERRFQKVAVRELGSEETLGILRARKERLEQHHNVLIADEALLAAVQLTDAFVTDRRRPDKALDALDEACAHAQAVAIYSGRAEALIAQRRQLLKSRGEGRAARDDRPEAAAADAPRPGANARTERRPDADETDPLERFAQNSVSALERFGAELEAIFAGGPNAPRTREQSPATTRDQAPSPLARRASSLAYLDSELSRQLMEEGIVVRGHDVARVVGLMVGQRIKWDD
ncbi:MAG: AAA family ATPase [Gemmatimonadota bacterium]|nr:AAA family ATPase [Gemmatimonadota bacterium]